MYLQIVFLSSKNKREMAAYNPIEYEQDELPLQGENEQKIFDTDKFKKRIKERANKWLGKKSLKKWDGIYSSLYFVMFLTLYLYWQVGPGFSTKSTLIWFVNGQVEWQRTFDTYWVMCGTSMAISFVMYMLPWMIACCDICGRKREIISWVHQSVLYIDDGLSCFLIFFLVAIVSGQTEVLQATLAATAGMFGMIFCTLMITTISIKWWYLFLFTLIELTLFWGSCLFNFIKADFKHASANLVVVILGMVFNVAHVIHFAWSAKQGYTSGFTSDNPEKPEIQNGLDFYIWSRLFLFLFKASVIIGSACGPLSY